MNRTFAAIGLAFTVTACSDPFVAEGTRAYTQVVTGGEHTCALASSGEAYCWGRGNDGELGIGVRESRNTPARVVGNLTFTDIAAGANHNCAIATDGTAYCWGWNAFFQRGNATDPRDAEPVPVDIGARFTAVAAGAHHSCAIGTDSLAYCWGNNNFGQLGDGSNSIAVTPKFVAGNLKFSDITAGDWHTCALTAAGGAYCWGRNDSGQLGAGSSEPSINTPRLVNANFSFAQIDAGATHSCGVARTNRFFCWGSNEFGELGNGGSFKPDLPAATSPAPVSDQFPTGLAIFAGNHHTCAISGTGRSRCWGRGLYGQIGNGAFVDHFQPQPIEILALDPAFTQIGAGGATHTCGIIDESVFCWGTGHAGQLGVPGGNIAPLPQRVGD